MPITTVQNIIDQARVKHPSFLSAGAPDGALVLGLNQRHREIVLKYADSIEGLISTSVSVATLFNGTLVGSVNGVPSFLTTYQDGYAVHSSNGVPYVNFSEAPIAGDPFGAHGGTPGFPLPSSFLKLINVTATYGDGSSGPINVIREGERHSIPQTRYPCAFVSGNRLVPARIPSNPVMLGGYGDDWSQNITALQLSYVALPTLSALTDTLMAPDVVIGSLVAGVAEHLAMLARDVDAATKAMFVSLRKEADSVLQEYAGDLVGDVQESSVIYRQ
jgi:hypothetical protein